MLIDVTILWVQFIKHCYYVRYIVFFKVNYTYLSFLLCSYPPFAAYEQYLVDLNQRPINYSCDRIEINL